MDATKVQPQRRSARERLLAAADELFYEGGIHSVGIDRVIERAGVAKASLYDCFGSKEELIRAYLAGRHERRKARILAKLESYATPRERLLGVFDAMAEVIADPNYRGCPFQRSGSESRPAAGVKAVTDAARNWLRDLFADLARDAGVRDPKPLVEQLMLLYDGASMSAQMEGGGGERSRRRRGGADARRRDREEGVTLGAGQCGIAAASAGLTRARAITINEYLLAAESAGA